jgi:tetratricopeptide (TPR) repeat protein
MAAMYLDEQAIFEAARKMEPGAAREAYLRQVCGGDAAMGQRVRVLLAALEGSASFLEAPALAVMATTDDPIGERPGTLIGPYKLLEQIGEGGFGVVFMADQTEPVRRKVALKVLKPGMDTRQVVARFEAERQALALMDHPNIARVLDGGQTSNGRPYFVMDLVKGLPITEYCDQAQLQPRERLELFVHLCQAVQHAHQKGIIHRDLKPSNVLVTLHDGTPLVKVIDFGIAKALGQQLTDKTVFTGFAQMVGTPLYMSPEQAAMSNIDVDTRSDVYSLGVLLYELLTGTTPFTKERLQQAGYDEMRRIIREEEPARPSTRISTLGQAAATVSTQRKSDPKRLSQLCRGELDWIVMKTLEKDRNRRYESSSAFAADVQRYLNDEPVQACPPSVRYRVHKFARRHKGGLAVAGLVVFFLLLLALGASGAGWWYLREQARQATTQGLAEKDILGAVEKAEEAREGLQGQLAKEGGIRRLLDEPARWKGHLQEAQLHLEKARGLEARMGRSLDPELMERLQVLETQLGQDEADHRLALRLEAIRLDTAILVGRRTGDAGAQRAYPEAFASAGLDVLEGDPQLVAAQVRQSAIREQVVAALDNWALSPWHPGKKGPGSVQLRLLKVARLSDPDSRRDQVRGPATWKSPRMMQNLASSLLADKAALHSLSPQMLDMVGTLLHFTRGDAEGWLRQAQLLYPADFWLNLNLGTVLATTKPVEAAGYFRVCLALRPNSLAAWNNLGVALRTQKDLAGAVSAYRKALEIDAKSVSTLSNLSLPLADQNDFEAAEATVRKALALDAKWTGAWINLGVVLARKKDFAGAEAANRRAVALDPQSVLGWTNLGMTLADQKDFAGAVKFHEKALAIDPKHAIASFNLGHALSLQKDDKGAEAAFRKAVALDPLHARAWTELAVVLAHQKVHAVAEDCFRKAVALDPKNAAVWYNLGLVLHDQRDFPGAIRAYKVALDLEPENPETWYNLGNTLHDHGDFPGAEAAFRKALKIDARDSLAWTNLGGTLAAQKNLKGAEAAYRRTLALKPNDALAWHNLGNALLEQKDHQGAEAAFRQALRIDPRRALTNCNLGLVLREQGKFDEALQYVEGGHKLGSQQPGWPHPSGKLVENCRQLLRLEQRAGDLVKGQAKPAGLAELMELAQFCQKYNRYQMAVDLLSKAIEVNREHAPAWCERGIAHGRLGQHDRSIADYSKAIKIRPTYAMAWRSRGIAYSELGHQERALADFSEAIRLEPDNSKGWHNRGNCHVKLRQYEAAIADYSRAIQLEPDSVTSWTDRGLARELFGQHEEAIADYSRAIELKPDFADAWVGRGNAYFRRNQLAEAVADYSMAIKHQSDYATAWHNRGASYFKLNQFADALADLSRAIQLKPGYLDAWHKRGIVHYKLNQPEKAVTDYSKAIELEKDHADAWEGRGLAYSRLGQMQNALKDLQQYRRLTRDSDRALNQLAWLFATSPEVRLRDPKQAVELAKRAVELAPKAGGHWNTLGVAHYRAGDYKAAVIALEKAAQLKNGGTGTDWFFLAMSRWKLDEHDRARKAYDRAVHWMKQHAPNDEDQRRCRAEAAEMLSIKKDP